MTLNFKQIVLLENDSYSYSTNKEGTILYHKHLSIQPFSKDEKKGWKELLKSKNFSSYVIEVKEGHLLPSEDKVWLENLDLKALHNAGISKVAYVSPLNIFNSLEIEKRINKKALIKIKVFRNLNDANYWLQQYTGIPDEI